MNFEKEARRLSAQLQEEFPEEPSVMSSAHKNQRVNQSSRLLDKSISIRVSKLDNNHELSVSGEEQDPSQVAEDTRNHRLSLFSQTGSMKSNYPDISDMYRKDKPSKFQEQVMRRKESEDLIKLGMSVDNSKAFLAEYSPSRFHMSAKNSKKEGQSDRYKKESDFESFASSRKLNDFREFQQALIKQKNDDDEPDIKRIALVDSNKEIGKKNANFSSEIKKFGGKVDTAQVLRKVRRAIRVRLLNNIKFFNILSKTYQIDERSMKQRYYYLYNDPSVDLEDLKKLIRDAKEKKEKDLKEILRKLNHNKIQQNETLRKLLFCCYKKTSHDEPDYSYKDKIDIPMKFEPTDNFVFNMYSPYLMTWNAMLFIVLLAQVFVKVSRQSSSHSAYALR